MDNLSKRENTIKMACEFEDFEDYIAYLNRQPKQRLDYFISRESFEKQMAEAILKEKKNPKKLQTDHEDSGIIFTSSIHPHCVY